MRVARKIEEKALADDIMVIMAAVEVMMITHKYIDHEVISQ